jgi:hypothetical protein
MLALVGAFNVVEGLVAIYDGKLVSLDQNRVLLLGPAGWAQVTVILGALLLALGIWLSMVTVGVRLVALSVVVVHALVQLGVLAAYPAWALLMISFDVVIIFALTATPAGSAASVARGATTSVRTGEAREGAKVPADTRIGVTGGSEVAGISSGSTVGGSTGGRRGYAAGERIGYRPRHQMAANAATVVLSQPLADAAPAGTTDAPAAPRALPAAPPVGSKTTGAKAAATATMVGAVARTTAAAATPGSTGTARGVAAPIIGAISGRWPDANQHA